MTRNLMASTLFLCLALAGPAAAAVTPPGLNLRWDNCYDDGGVSNKTFACDSNSGTERLVLSFVLDSPMDPVSGMEIRAEFWSASASMPAWWQFKNPGTCRAASLSMDEALSPSAVNCLDWSAGGSAGGIGAYNIGLSGPNMAMLIAAAAVPPDQLQALDPNQEYFIANLKISHTKTVGTGACAGCDVPMCIVFAQLNVTTPVLANNRKIITGANGVNSQLATWQNALPVNPHVLNAGVTGGGPRTTIDACVVGPPIGVGKSTWGAVKSLYR